MGLGHSLARHAGMLFSLGTIALGWLLYVPSVDALTVSPSRVVLRAKPKQVRVGFFTLQQEGEASVHVKIEPEDWAEGLTGSRGRVTWLTVIPTQLTLQPGKSAKVKYTVRVPHDAQGELRTQVFFTTEGLSGSVPMRTRLGAILYVAIEGTERVDGAITKIDVNYTASTPGVAPPDRLDVLLRVHNRSNTHVIPHGEVTVRDPRGATVTVLPIQRGWGLLPQEEDAYHAIGHGVILKPGPYTLEVNLLIGGDVGHPLTLHRQLDMRVNERGAIQLLELKPSQTPAPSRS